MSYPKAYQRMAMQGNPSGFPEIFDPALKHYSRAFRLGDPEFPNTETRRAWYAARRQVVDHLLRLVAGSVWSGHLVLRGSLLLKAWLGDAAREPGDIDWVFRRAAIASDAPLAQELLADLQTMAAFRRRIGNTVIQVERITVDDIWTYERSSGRRIVFPWLADDLPPGQVQMDIVFREELLVDPFEMQIPSLSGGDSIRVWAATPELSLAWKLLWLQTDMYPQGKDLYDATLLAEQTPLSLDLLHRVLLQSEDGKSYVPLDPEFPMLWDVDWEEFKREYPWVCGEAIDWKTRLTDALAPLFDSQP